MLTPEKTQLLLSFLGSLPKDAAARLAAAVEVDRITEGSLLPHDLILEGVRPALRASEEHKRTPTPLRLFCRPFEDLLVNAARNEKQKGRVLRSHVMPVWQWVSRSLIPDQTNAYCVNVRRAVVARRYDDAVSFAETFWPLAGHAMADAIASRRKDVRTALGSDLAVADAEDIALMLMVGSSMVAVKGLLPKPTPALTEDLLWGLRRMYEHICKVQLDAGPFVSVVAMRRLAKPWEALKLALLVARQTQDTLISSTDMGLAGDVLLADMEDNRAGIMAVRHPAFDVDALLRDLASFTNISSAIVKEVEILRHGRWGQRLLKDRAAVGAVMDGFMERAPKEIAAALPSHKSGFSGGPRVPDFSRFVDAERVERALRYARLLAGTRHLAVPGSFGATHTDAVEEASQVLRSYNEDMLKELRTAEGVRREIVERQYELACELTTLVIGESEAEFLRRRHKAAAVARTAAA
jgi:hypothetical protein